MLGDAKEHTSIASGRIMFNLTVREGASMTTMAASICQSSQQAINVAEWVLDRVGKMQETPEVQLDRIESPVRCSRAILTNAIADLLDTGVAGE